MITQCLRRFAAIENGCHYFTRWCTEATRCGMS